MKNRLGEVVAEKVLEVAKLVEDSVDEEIDQLGRLEKDDLDRIRRDRFQQLKKLAEKRKGWIAQGHGEYYAVGSEKDFFAQVKASERVVCHFYRENWPCKVMDKHLTILAKQHMETKFMKINAEKSPYLCEKLRVVMLPTLAVIKDGKAADYVVGFDELGGRDDFKTEILEERLESAGVIFHDGVAMTGYSTAAESSQQQQQQQRSQRSIRQSTDSDSDDEE